MDAQFDLLIVEDDEFLNRIYDNVFRKIGVKFAIVTDGEKAFAWLKQNSTKLIILDLVMPNMNGIQFLERKEKDEKSKFVKTMVVSNLSNQDMVSELSGYESVMEVLTKANNPISKIADIAKKNLCLI